MNETARPTQRRFEDKVVFISGVARGQGRSHALRFAAEGASIIGLDVCADDPFVPYPLATEEDLAETTRQIEALGAASVLRKADVRDFGAQREVVHEGLERFGRLDIICANAGVYSPNPTVYLSDDAWDAMIDINLSGVFRTVRAGIKAIVKGDRGGSVIMTSSTAGLRGFYGSPAYSAAKHGLVGFMRTLALELAPNNIRVNCIHPTSVDTPMIHNEVFPQLVAAGKQNPGWEDAQEFLATQHPMLVSAIDADDVSNAVLWLASDEARYVTGVTLPVDAGAGIK